MSELEWPRKCGILCHVTSLPGPFGIGGLGEECFRFVDYLEEAGQSLWQVLPLGPTGYGNSPYQSFSAFAGNPLLIDPAGLVADGLLSWKDVGGAPAGSPDRVDYGAVIPFKEHLLRLAYERFRRQAGGALGDAFEAFRCEQAGWLEDYCLFMALKRHFHWRPWYEWDRKIALHQEDALRSWREALAEEVDFQAMVQFLFERQWARVRAYAHRKGVQIIGDLPIFVGYDSADVWAHRELFQLDEEGRPRVVAGVPPDYFSPTGQLWGNPHYRWDLLAERGFDWWIARLRRALTQVDVVRIDHFRGFVAYWEVPAGERTAINGRWVPGPGRSFFDAVHAALGDLPIIAEDLGMITEDVHALRDELGLPGMRVIQFAFDSDVENPHLPYNHVPNCVVYTGTHDNDTTLGWYRTADELRKHWARRFSGSDGSDIHWAFIRLAMMSVAQRAIYPLQDVLGLGSEARMNTPGRASGNWAWRFRKEWLRPELASRLRDLADAYGRWLSPYQRALLEAKRTKETRSPA